MKKIRKPDLWNLFNKESFSVRMHAFIRGVLCPFSDIIGYFPAKGEILDFGCGHGVLLHFLSADPGNEGRVLRGFDHAPNKIEIANRNAVGGMFFTDNIGSIEESTFEAVGIVDVLYTVPKIEWKTVLDKCFSALKPGGIIIVKEALNTPKWKYRLTMAEETVAVRIMNITKGDRPHFESRETYCEALRQSGFINVTNLPINRPGWVSHCLFTGQKPA